MFLQTIKQYTYLRLLRKDESKDQRLEGDFKDRDQRPIRIQRPRQNTALSDKKRYVEKAMLPTFQTHGSHPSENTETHVNMDLCCSTESEWCNYSGELSDTIF